MGGLFLPVEITLGPVQASPFLLYYADFAERETNIQNCVLYFAITRQSNAYCVILTLGTRRHTHHHV